MNKKAKISAVLLAATLSISLLSGCSKAETKPTTPAAVPQVITFNLGAEPKTIDPALSTAIV